MAASAQPPARPGGDTPAARRPRARRGLVLACLVVIVLASAGSVWAYPHWQAAQDWRHAREALADDDPTHARVYLNRYLAARPRDSEAHLLMSRACRRQGEYGAAWQHLSLARKLEHPEADLDLEHRLLLAQTGSVREVAGDLIGQFQEGHYEEVLILEALTTGYLKADLLHDAAEWATIWLDRYPDHWQPWLHRGRSLQLRWLFDLAVPDFRRALELRPGEPQACLWLASALASNGRFDEALGHYEEYLRARPGDPTGLIGAAYCHLARNDVGAARAAVDQVLAGNARDPAALLLRGQVELRGERPQEALVWLRRAEAVAPHESDIITSLIDALRRLGQSQEADRYEVRLKESRQQLQKLEDVVKRLSAGSGQDRAGLRHEGAMILMRLERTPEALRWLESALQENPAHGPSHQALADYYERRGDRQRAADHRRRMIGHR